MTKERFIEGYGVPRYTVGVGGSGGAIQQYVYAQNHPGVIRRRDPAVLVPRHGHADDPRRRLRAARALHGRHRRRQPEVVDVDEPHVARGHERERTRPNPYRGGAPGNTECVNGWRGLTPLALNPLFGTAGAGRSSTTRRDRGGQVDALGRPPQRLRRRRRRLRQGAVGQRRRAVRARALASGNITPRSSSKLNATVGSWKERQGHGAGGLPVHPGPLRRYPGAVRPVEPAQHDG